jgi:hypothetical protein
MVRRNLVLEPEIVEQPLLTRFQPTHYRQTPSRSIPPRQNHGSGNPATRLFQQLRRPGRLELYVDGFSRASSTATATNTSALFGIYRWGWGFSTSQDFNGDIALIACFASSWTPAMVRRWHADPFGFLRPWNELPALMGSAPPATLPSTGTGVVTFLMG